MSNTTVDEIGDGSTPTHRPDADTPPEPEVQLHRLLTLRTVEHFLGRLLDERFTRLATAGLRYPLTSRDPLQTALLGGYLILPLAVVLYSVFTTNGTAGPLTTQLYIGGQVITFGALALIGLSIVSTPVLGFLTYVVQQSVMGNTELHSFPQATAYAEWLKLGVVGTKVLVIVGICLLTPLTFASNAIGGIVGGSFSHFFTLTPAKYMLLVGSVVLVSFYPAIIGTFVKHGQLATGLNSPKRPIVTSHEYLRGISVLISIVAAAGFAVHILFGLYGYVSLVFVGPTIFYFLLSIHHIIGLSWKETTEQTVSEYQYPELTVLKDRSSAVDPVAKAFENDPERHIYEISTWDVRTRVDRIAVRLYEGLRKRPMLLVSAYLVLMAIIQLSRQGGYVDQLDEGLIILISIAPAGLLTSYIVLRYRTPNTAVRTLAVTFVLGAVFAMCIYTVTAIFEMGPQTGHIGSFVFLLFVLAPATEISKLLAVRLYAYRCQYFNAVIDGAIYGVVAGLGFGIMLNIWTLLDSTSGMDTVVLQTLSAPLAVLFTGITGYYLGLAKFNTEAAGPILAKGLFITVVLATIHKFLMIVLAETAAESSLETELVAGTQFQFLTVEILGTTVITSLFLVALTVMLLRRLSKYSALYEEISRPVTKRIENQTVETDRRFADRTAELQKLYDAGLITDAEFYTLSANS